MEQNIFEVATRNKLRFPFRGQISVEDLWDLRPAQLNEVFQNIQAQHQDVAESLIAEETEQEIELALQADIVRHIFNVKKAEAEAKELEAQRKEKKRRIQEILARKGEEALNNMSEAELQEMIKNL